MKALNISSEASERVTLMMAFGVLKDMYRDGAVDERTFHIIEKEYIRRLEITRNK